MAWKRGEKLGFGKFGVVYACAPEEDPQNFRFAQKKLQTDMAASEEVRARFSLEVEILTSLDHENVMRVVDSGETAAGVPWLVMPRADESLQDVLDRTQSALDEDRAVAIIRDVLAGVAHAHDEGVYHRDIKPRNILLFGDRAVVNDFGIAKMIDYDGTTLTTTAQELGTYRYVAPEQFRNAKQAGPQADVYSIGKVFAQMLTGERPEPLQVNVAAVPQRYRYFVNRCCNEDPARRFRDAGEALAHLDRQVTPPEVELPPLDRGRQLLAELREASDENALAAFDALGEHLAEHEDDQDLIRAVVPRIPRHLVPRLAGERLDELRRSVRLLEQQLDDDLRFEYCDVVADFCREVFVTSDDLDLLHMTFERLIVMGARHNRFHVHDVVCELVPSIRPQDSLRVPVAVEAFERYPKDGAWYAEALLRKPLPGPVAEAIRKTQGR